MKQLSKSHLLTKSMFLFVIICTFVVCPSPVRISNLMVLSFLSRLCSVRGLTSAGPGSLPGYRQRRGNGEYDDGASDISSTSGFSAYGYRGGEENMSRYRVTCWLETRFCRIHFESSAKLPICCANSARLLGARADFRRNRMKTPMGSFYFPT